MNAEPVGPYFVPVPNPQFSGTLFSGGVRWRIARGRSRYAILPRFLVVRDTCGTGAVRVEYRVSG